MHTSVLLREAIDGLQIQKGDVVIDATLGGGGHAEAILETFGDTVTLIGFDVDHEAIERSQKRLAKFTDNSAAKHIFIQSNFRFIARELATRSIEKVDRVLFDLGVSSFQIGASGRGLSFQYDEPLHMTLSGTTDTDKLTAYDIVNTWDTDALANVLYAYGEERYAKRIAEAIVQARKEHPIETTFALVEIIRTSVPTLYRHGKLHFATRTFQALRIAVNDELDALRDALTASFALLTPTGRIAVISFHSLEDRIVKHFIQEKSKQGEGIALTKKPLTPTHEESISNPRSRSAKLRIIEKI